MAIVYDLEETRHRGVPPCFEGGNRLMFITHRTERMDECEQIRAVLRGGCTWVQLRRKEGLNLPLVEGARAICESESAASVDLCIDDNLLFAMAGGATAVHLGKRDMPVDEAWACVEHLLPPRRRFFIGATANTFEDIRHAVRAGASYIGLGPYRFTETKSNLSPILGADGYRRILEQCRETGITIPVFAIGGIGLPDVPLLMRMGITGIAVSGAIIQSPDPVATTRQFIETIHSSI